MGCDIEIQFLPFREKDIPVPIFMEYQFSSVAYPVMWTFCSQIDYVLLGILLGV